MVGKCFEIPILFSVLVDTSLILHKAVNKKAIGASIPDCSHFALTISDQYGSIWTKKDQSGLKSFGF